MAKRKSLTPLFLLGAVAAGGFYIASKKRFQNPSVSVMPVGGWIFYWKGNTPMEGLPEDIRIAKPIKPGGLYAYTPTIEPHVLIRIQAGIKFDDIVPAMQKFNEENPV